MPASTKQEALNLFEIHRAKYLALAREVAEKVYHRQGYVTTDDIRELCDVPQEYKDRRVLGSVFQAHEWQTTGKRIKSKFKDNHGRKIEVWELKPEYRHYRQTLTGQLVMI